MTNTTTYPITKEIAKFVCDTQYSDFPKETIEIAKRCIVDGTGVLIAGSTEDCAAILRQYASTVAGVGEARTLGQGSIKAPVHLAALVNGIAGHALDWDDTALSEEKDRSVLIHPTMQPLCACFALGEYLHVSPEDFLTAFIVGFEVQVKMAEAIHPDHFTGGRGFHTSGTLGIFGAMAASCKLLALSEEQILNAFGLASTMSAGVGVNHGTMAKPLNMGRAAENGVTAARFASLGMDAKHNSLEGGRGFFEAFGGGFEPSKISGRLGNPFAIINPGTSIKPYPSGVVGHPGMDAMKKLITENDIAPEDIEKIEVKTGGNVIAPGPLRIPHASTALEGKFCVPFQMAAIALRRKAGLAEFSDEFVQSEECQAMQHKVDAQIDPEIDALGKDKLVFRIRVLTRSGEVFSQESEPVYRGGPKNPLTWEELSEKFYDATQKVLSEEQATAFLDLVADFESLPSIESLLDTVTV